MYEFIMIGISVIAGLIFIGKFLSEFWEFYKLLCIFICPILFGLGVMLGGLITIAGGHLIQEHIIGTYTEQESIPIVSLKQNNRVEGSFFLGIGSIEGIAYYLYFRNLGDSRYKRGRIKASKTIIQEGFQESPTISWTRVRGKVNWFIHREYIDRQEDYVLHVPKGTIIKQFKLE